MYKHIHIIPKENHQLLNKITSPELEGTSITEVWNTLLKKPENYIAIAPKELLDPLRNHKKAGSLM